MIRPPATSSVTPVIHRAESDARNSAAIAGSSGTPIEPSGDMAAIWARRSSSIAPSTRSLRIVAGASTFTRTPCSPSSSAAWRLSIAMPAFAAA